MMTGWPIPNTTTNPMGCLMKGNPIARITVLTSIKQPLALTLRISLRIAFWFANVAVLAFWSLSSER